MDENRVITNSGIPVKSIHTPSDCTNALQTDSLAEPGSFPFTRGIYPEMYRTRLWTMRQYTGFGNAEATNRRFKFLIRQGQTGLSTAFDLPTQLGYDSDNEKAEGEVGRVGVPISSVEDMALLFAGIGLKDVSTSMTINATASVMLAMYCVVGASQGTPLNALRGTTQNDILKEYIARNTYIFPPKPSLKLSVDIVEFCSKEMGMWYPLSISGYHIREAGANAIQELAYAFADAKEYVRACLDRGLSVDEFAPRLSFFFACHNEFLEEIAKFRAARRIWARIMKDEFHSTKPESMMLRFHTQTSGETLNALQPENNVVRVAIQALAAVLGGTQSLHTNSLDEALSLPTEESVKLALRTQQIIAHETGVVKTVDPIGGSYYLEYLTERIEHAVLDEIAQIERMGGAVRAIENDYIQSRIRESAFQQQADLEAGRRIVVGVNKYVEKEPLRVKIHRVDSSAVRRQVGRVKAVKRKRDKSKVEMQLAKVKEALDRDDNVMPFIIEAVRARATTGEISDVMRGIYGEFRPRVPVLL